MVKKKVLNELKKERISSFRNKTDFDLMANFCFMKVENIKNEKGKPNQSKIE